MAILGNSNKDEDPKKRRSLFGNKVAAGVQAVKVPPGKQPRKALLGKKIAEGLAVHADREKKPSGSKTEAKAALKTAFRRMLR